MAIVRFDPFRTTREFDRLTDQFLGLVSAADRDTGFAPAYDIEQHDEHTYVINIALPGVAEDAIELTTHEGVLTVTSKAAPTTKDGVKALYKGISAGRFERRFQLAEHVEVAEARMERGILSIKLVRNVPEALKPRTIQVMAGPDAPRVVEQAA